MDGDQQNSAFTKAGLDTADIVVVIIFIFFCLLVGIWATWRTQRGSVSGYFLAGRDILWFAVGASLFSSNIGSGSFVGLAGTGAANGIAVASYEFNGLFCLLLLGWIFVPVYIASGVYTMPEYLMKRFGGQRLQLYMAFLSLVIYVFTKISADIYAGAIFILQAVRIDMYLAICILLVVTAIYTVSGGLRAVIYTDTLQTVIMVIGALILMGISFDKVGGITALYEKYHHAIASHHKTGNGSDTDANSTCGTPSPNAFHLFRPADVGDIPWPGNVFGITILSSWYFCNDQVLVQRSLAAKNMHHVKGGSILAAYLKILPLFTTVFPGMISRILFTDEVACTDPDVCEQVCGNRAGCTNIAYPKLVIELLPPGVKGLMLAAMIAALMSSLTSNFNSAATIFTIDIWKRFRAKATDGELLVVGRIFIILLVGLSVAWIPILQASQGGQLFSYVQSVTGYFAPPILALFTLAILWPRTNEKGAFGGLMVGLVVGVVRMGLDFGYDAPGCGEEDTRPVLIAKVHFLHFTCLLFAISFIATIVISLLTEPLDRKHLVRVTWWTRHSQEERQEFPEELRQRRARKRKTARPLVALDDNDSSNRSEPPANNAREETGHIDQVDVEVAVVEPKTPPRWKRVVYLLCGYEPPKETELSEEEEKRQMKLLTSIEEDPFWKKVVNINAVVLMVFGVFLWAFFG